MTEAPATLRSFLDRMLTEGKALARRGEDLAADKLGVGDAPEDREGMRRTALGAGAAAGILGLLLGSRGGRGLLRTGAAVGGLAVLGKLAHDAWKGDKEADGAERAPALDELSEEEADRRAETLAWALVAAAKADGHIDEAEQAAIESALRDLPLSVRANMTTVMMRPADAAAIAARATSDQERREIYAASVLLTDRDHPQEAAWLSTLATALNLPADQVAAIEAGLEAV